MKRVAAVGVVVAAAIAAAVATAALSGGDAFVQLGPKLVGHGQERGQGYFGRTVALSGNGKTAVIGAAYNEVQDGAAWIFVRSGSTWKQQGARLGTGSADSFGTSVAVSSDGDTALISEPVGAGRVWVYVRAGRKWKQQQKLTGQGARGLSEFGDSVALSADAKTAIVGGSLDHKNLGAAWVFTRVGTRWRQHGPKLTPRGEHGTVQFGLSVALSGDGRTALVGAPADGKRAQGAAWIFTRSGAQWRQQGAKLTGPGRRCIRSQRRALGERRHCPRRQQGALARSGVDLRSFRLCLEAGRAEADGSRQPVVRRERRPDRERKDCVDRRLDRPR